MTELTRDRAIRQRAQHPLADVPHWWDGDPDEIFWFETTDRTDLGRDLNAPQLGEEDRPHWSYDFVTLVAQGDVVVHYKSRPEMAVVGWSRVAGRPYADEVFWGAHG